MKNARKTLAVTALVFFSASALAQIPNQSLKVEWNVEILVDAAKAKKNPGVAKAAESTLKLMGGSIGIASITDQLTFRNGSYAIASQARANPMIASLLPNSTATRTSRGRADGSYMTSVEFTEERTKGHQRKVVLDYGKKTSFYFKAGQAVKQEPLPYRTADLATLPYLFYKKAVPTSMVAVAATDGLSTRLFRLAPTPDSVSVDGKTIPAVKLTHQATTPNEAGLSVWIRKSDGFPLRIRLDMNARYGAIMDQQLKALPAGI